MSLGLPGLKYNVPPINWLKGWCEWPKTDHVDFRSLNALWTASEIDSLGRFSVEYADRHTFDPEDLATRRKENCGHPPVHVPVNPFKIIEPAEGFDSFRGAKIPRVDDHIILISFLLNE